MSDPFNDYASNINEGAYESTTLSCSVPVLSILGTVFGWIGGVIVFFLEKQNVYVRAVSLQSTIINGIIFVIGLFFLCFYWAHTFFVVMFWMTFALGVIVVVALTIVAFVKAKSGLFVGIPPLGGWILKVANH